MSFILTLHGEVRWLLALLAVAAIVKFAAGLIAKQNYKGLDRGLMSGYTILMDINLLMGLILLFGLGGGLTMPRIEHATTMILAVGVAHSSAAWRKSDDDQKKFRNNLIVVVVSLLLIVVGVLRLRGGWVFG